MENSIKKTRNHKNISQEKLAEMVGISRTHLSEIENGYAMPSVAIAQKIAQALEDKTDNIFFADSVV